MRFLVTMAAICMLSTAAFAETQDCKILTDPAARLTCYDKINPPIATYPIPLPKPSHAIPLTRPDGTTGNPDSAVPSRSSTDGTEDAIVDAKMNSICRGC